MKDFFQKNRLKIAIVISLILHLLFFIFYKQVGKINLFPVNAEELMANQPEQERRLEFELVETPDDARSETPPEETDLVSDKNSRARDNAQNRDIPVGGPFSKGEFDVKELPQMQAIPTPQEYAKQQPEAPAKDATEESDPTTENFTYEKFSRQQLIKPTKQQRRAQQDRPDKPVYDNQKFRAEDLGGFTFNTYEWNFAPYMLAMKKKVERNIFPPPAFTHMGLISGESVIRFKVMPNGEVKDIKVLDYSGHESLKETSVQALINSSRLKPLPADFPEDYLEVTANFHYYVRR